MNGIRTHNSWWALIPHVVVNPTAIQSRPRRTPIHIYCTNVMIYHDRDNLVVSIRYMYHWDIQLLNNIITVSTKALLLQAWVITAAFGYPIQALYPCSQRRFNCPPFKYLFLSVPDEFFTRTMSCVWNHNDVSDIYFDCWDSQGTLDFLTSKTVQGVINETL